MKALSGQIEKLKKKKARLQQDINSLQASADMLLTKAETKHAIKYVTKANSLRRNCERIPPPSVWPHLFCGAGHEKTRGEQLKWSLAFRLYIGSFSCAQLPGPVHTAQLG